MNSRLLSLALLLLFVAPFASQSQIPRTISYQGVLQKDGSPFSGDALFTFTLYKGSAAAWTSQPIPAHVNNGLFSTILGPFPDTLRFNGIDSLGISFNGTQLSPRIAMTAAAFSLASAHAAFADSAANPGPAGLKGDKGDKGDIGPAGTPGVVGLKGDKGDKGIDGLGLKGDKGDKGDIGPAGTPGVVGLKGDKGDKGIDGLGLKGDKGDKGDMGPAGTPGVAGSRGDNGGMVRGIPGVAGLKGDKGDKGDMGPAGTPGIAGIEGSTKADEVDIDGLGFKGLVRSDKMFHRSGGQPNELWSDFVGIERVIMRSIDLPSGTEPGVDGLQGDKGDQR